MSERPTLARAAHLRSRGMLDQAADVLRRMIDARVDLPAARIALAVVLADRGDEAAAESLLDAVFPRTGPDDPVRAAVAALRQGKAELAARHIAEAEARRWGDPAGLAAARAALGQLTGDRFRWAAILDRQREVVRHPQVSAELAAIDAATTRLSAEFGLAATAGDRVAMARLLESLEITAQRAAAILGASHPTAYASAAALASAEFRAHPRSDANLRRLALLTTLDLGRDHPQAVTAHLNAAVAGFEVARAERRDLAEALGELRSSARAAEDVLGPDHPTTVIAWSNAASAEFDAARIGGDPRKLAEVLDTLTTTAGRVVAAFGRDHPTARVLDREIALCRDQAGAGAGTLLTRTITSTGFGDDYVSVDQADQLINRRPATRLRQAIINHLDHFRTVQDLYDELRSQGEETGLTTVYRTVRALADDGAVEVRHAPSGETLYRRPAAIHHLVCRSCGRTVEVAGPAVEQWASRVAAEHGFTDISPSVELFGLCDNCGGNPWD
ncbi:transcriptional repressor [Actinokineospora sp. NPDC004072]